MKKKKEKKGKGEEKERYSFRGQRRKEEKFRGLSIEINIIPLKRIHKWKMIHEKIKRTVAKNIIFEKKIPYAVRRKI